MSHSELSCIDDDFSDMFLLFSGKKVEEVTSLLLAMAAKYQWSDAEILQLAGSLTESIAFAALCLAENEGVGRK